jgi:hypothetical protein
MLFIFWMRHELDCLETTYYTVESERLPDEFDGVRFVLLSDLHNKSFGKQNGRLLSAIARQKPDFIVAAGDLVTAKKKEGDVAAKELMKVLGKQYDVFYGRGNHEERLSETDRGFEEEIRKCGVHYLHNESVFLVRGESKIRITGLSLPMEYFEKFHQTSLDGKTIEELIGNKRDTVFNLLIAHKPAHFFEYVSWGADLIVSGHLHGGMIRLPFLGGVVSPQLEIFPKFDAGKFILGKSTMIISRGLGSHSIPIRIHNRPELVVVTLKKKEV